MNKALTLFDNFNQLTPYAVGFDRIFNDLQRYTENTVTSTGFPPYNISQHDEDNYTIELERIVPEEKKPRLIANN